MTAIAPKSDTIMDITSEIKRGWEQSFPSLDGKWTHWKILAGENTLAIVDGMDLIGAMKVVEENYGKYTSIKACRAAYDDNQQLEEESNNLFEISKFEYDEMIRVPNENLKSE